MAWMKETDRESVEGALELLVGLQVRFVTRQVGRRNGAWS